MSEKGDQAKLEFILKMIQVIELIVERHETSELALNDVEGQNALYMCLMQIGENLNKIKSEKYQELLPIKKAYGVRNYLAHDYEGINIFIIKDIIDYKIPELKEIILKILK